MARTFTKRPVIIEAFQYALEIAPAWFTAAEDAGIVAQGFDPVTDVAECTITTLNGPVKASAGEWIIKGTAGELYPCRPDIFAETYEEVTR